MRQKLDIEWLTGTDLPPALKTISCSLFCTQNAYISSLACTSQKIFFPSISVLIYAVCNETRKKYKQQIHFFKSILSADHELLTYYTLNIVKMIPVTCYMSPQLFPIEKWTNRSTRFLIIHGNGRKRRIYQHNVDSEKLQYPFWRTLSSPVTYNTEHICHNRVSLNLKGNFFFC